MSAITTLFSKIKNILNLGAIIKHNEAQNSYQVQTFDNEVLEDVPNYQSHGFSSIPRSKTRVLVFSDNGNKNNPVIVGDNSYVQFGGEIPSLHEGDVIVWTSENNYIHFTHSSNLAQFKTNKLEIVTSEGTQILQGDMIVSVGDIKAEAGDVSDQSLTTPTMQDIRDLFNNHVHPTTSPGSPTTKPTTQM